MNYKMPIHIIKEEFKKYYFSRIEMIESDFINKVQDVEEKKALKKIFEAYKNVYNQIPFDEIVDNIIIEKFKTYVKNVIGMD